LRLCSFEELGTGREIPLLDAGEAIVGSSFVDFPAQSDGLTPLEIKPERQNFPRFSRFQFQDLMLQGQRLLSIGPDFFNDLSLVDREFADTDFNRKLQAGYSEQVPYDLSRDAVNTAADARTIDCSDCAVIASNESSSYGSWLFRILPKVLLDRMPPRRVMVFSEFPWIPELLRTFVPDIEIIPHLPHETYRLINPTIPSLASAECFHRREIQDALEPAIERAMRAFPKTPEKVYLSRRKMALSFPSHRVLENETELIEQLLTLGFTEYFPEDHALLEQIGICAQARVIVAAGGSNLFNCYFARKAELIIDLESSDIFVQHHANVLASCGRPFSIVRGVRNERGRHEHHMNWTIDIDTFMEGLRRTGMLHF
jgi:capsular polysaccharide biosynthesis protein